MNRIEFVALCFAWTVAVSPAFADDEFDSRRLEPLVRVVDLNVGETADVELCDGTTRSVKLVSLVEHRDAVREAVRRSDLVLEIDGQRVELDAGAYRLPKTAAGVQVDCSVTGGMNKGGTPAFWGLDKDARLRFWPEGSPLFHPGTIIYPVKQAWMVTRTWFDNEVVDGGLGVRKQIDDHAELDIGASEGLTEVIAATDALVVQRGLEVLPDHATGTPAEPRYDVVYLLDPRGWYYRYSHLKEIDPAIQPGRVIRQGTRIGTVGKEGSSGGWSHLHFEIKSRQPSGKWGTQAGYAFLREACIAQEDLQLIAVARPAHFLVAGEQTTLDGTRSWSADGDIRSFEWTLHDGTKKQGATVPVTYADPGVWCETLKVVDGEGRTDYDFAYVVVLDANDLGHYPANVNINFHPTHSIRPGDEVTFKARAFRMKGGQEQWDFGDGSPPGTTRSPEDSEPHAPDGYAAITHRYQRPGKYLVTVTRTHDNGQTAMAKLCVTVESPNELPVD